MPSANVIQLRQMLSEKFPGLRLRLNGSPAAGRLWPTGLAQIDEPLSGGLPKGALTEVVSTGKSSGGATLMRALLAQAAVANQIATLVDSQDALDVTAMGEAALSRLLWVRCRTAEEAMKAADLILRDANLPLLLMDLKMAPPAQLRRIPATTWYRFQRLVEETEAIGVVFTPSPMISPARVRITLPEQFSLRALESDAGQLLAELRMETVDLRHGAGTETALLNTA